MKTFVQLVSAQRAEVIYVIIMAAFDLLLRSILG